MRGTNLSALPFEVLHDILWRLDRNDLKSMRRVSRYHGGAATTILYNTIHISPNVRSIGRALKIALRQDLAAHVRNIVYHVGLIEAVYTKEAFIAEVTKVTYNLPPQQVDWDARTERMYRCYLDETAAQEIFAELDEHQELSSLMSNFNHLTSIATVRDEYDPFSPPQGYIESRTGLPAAGFYEGSAFASLFEATAHSELASVHGDALSWDIFLGLNAQSTTPVRLDRLHDLHLGLYNSELHHYHDPVVVLPELRRFLRLCGNLEMLSLDLDEFPLARTEQFLECVSREALYKCHFPRLSCLKLRGLISFEERLMRFLESHSKTLRALELADLMVVRRSTVDNDVSAVMSTYTLNDDRAEHQASIVSVFQKIHDLCKLDRAKVAGNFTNRYDEAWYVTETVQEGFVSRIQRFLCRQGPSPFPPWPRYQRMQEASTANSRVTAEVGDSFELEPAAMQFCDETWEWCPELLV
ncbi:uncharacterized protein PV07_03390 [Cladophialophora immunda]|uniref:F-box domain-containing protein n=1 Tax=Cladophialophora immunda TaxID=569365 RepID=A0A0D2CKT3_9EURO|nr:uncharacterized protein PV07_03390 [Cladophialophora immunda]KIW31798.1 hypothetical protein PV07_03390 [Cladophialophora immunda]